MIKGFLKDVNIKRFTISVLVMFVFIFITDFLIHGLILKNEYAATAAIWRTEAEMQGHMIYMLIGQLLIAKYFTFLFVKGYQGTGPMEGVRFGILISFLFIGTYFVQYAVSPLTCNILTGWSLGALAQGILGGVLLTLVYKR